MDRAVFSWRPRRFFSWRPRRFFPGARFFTGARVPASGIARGEGWVGGRGHGWRLAALMAPRAIDGASRQMCTYMPPYLARLAPDVHIAQRGSKATA